MPAHTLPTLLAVLLLAGSTAAQVVRVGGLAPAVEVEAPLRPSPLGRRMLVSDAVGIQTNNLTAFEQPSSDAVSCNKAPIPGCGQKRRSLLQAAPGPSETGAFLSAQAVTPTPMVENTSLVTEKQQGDTSGTNTGRRLRQAEEAMESPVAEAMEREMRGPGTEP